MDRTNWMPLLASIGIGAAAYQMMNPQNRMTDVVRRRMNRMRQAREMFPNQ